MWIGIVAICLAFIGTKGLSYGIDFEGGTELKMELVEEQSDEVVNTVVTILKNRLNGLGLKSTQVLKEADGRHITIKVSTTDDGELADVKAIINQQAVFEQYVEGELCATGLNQEIELDIGQQGGSTVVNSQWRVNVKTTGEAPSRCGEVMEGKAGRMTDIFLDRPSKSFILLDADTCLSMSNTDFNNHPDDVDYSQLSFIEDRALIPVVCYTTIDASDEPALNESLLGELGVSIENKTKDKTLNLDDTVDEIKRLFAEGKAQVIISTQLTNLPEQLQEAIAEINITVDEEIKAIDQEYHVNYGFTSSRPDNTGSWIDLVTGLKSTLRISPGLTHGTPVYSSIFEGGAASNKEARETAEKYVIWLTSGNLPVKTEIILERPNLPELGQQFLRYAAFIALIALGLVAAIISIRYREWKISLAILTTSFSEIIMIVGFASIASWELDLAAMAGIIAAIGTGVDHQIIITDETLRGERKSSDSKVWDIKQSINRAFFIILTSAVTTICAMLPLMSIIDLRGFAFTSIIGVGIGILISRPAYARIVELIT